MKKIFIIYFILILPLVLSGQPGRSDWPVYRGSPDLTGRSAARFPANPVLKWSLNTNARTISSPVVGSGMVFFGNNEGEIIAVDLAGKIKWKYNTGTAIEASPSVFDGKVYIGSLDGRIVALNSKDGSVAWSYETENQVTGSVNMWEKDGKKYLLAGSYDFSMYCLEPSSGRLVWKVETDNFIHGTAAISGSDIIFGGCDGMLRVIDASSGKEKASADLGAYIATSPALAGNRAYVGSYEGILYSVNLQTMEIEWEIPARNEQSVIMATPAFYNGKLVIGSEDKYVSCINSSDGKLLWEHRTNGTVVGSAIMSDREAVVGSRDGWVYIFDLLTGKVRWKFDTGKAISSSPAYAMGTLFVLTEDGRLLAFGDK